MKPCSSFSHRLDLSAAERGGYEYFMLKEHRGAARVSDTLLGHFADAASCSTNSAFRTRSFADRQVFVVACGTAYHSGLLAKYAIEHWTGCPSRSNWPANSGYRDPVLDSHTLVSPSRQSGETQTHWGGEAVRHARSSKGKCWPSATPTVRRFRANATPCSTRGPAGDRCRVDEDVPGADTANYLSGLPLRSPRYKVPDEVEREYRALEAMPEP